MVGFPGSRRLAARDLSIARHVDVPPPADQKRQREQPALMQKAGDCADSINVACVQPGTSKGITYLLLLLFLQLRATPHACPIRNGLKTEGV